MEANELRIGNFTYHSELGIVEVIAVGKDYIHCLFNGETFYESIGRFSPVPLVEEWLLKFGFKLENNTYWNENVSILGLENDRYIHFDGGRVFIRSIHQLQNLFFALKGEELTLK